MESQRSYEGEVYCHNGHQLPYHPLLNPEILSTVFGHFNMGDCKQFRLVNKTWRDELQQRWMNETVIKIVLMQPQDDEEYIESSPTSKYRECVHNFKGAAYFLNEQLSPQSIRNLRFCHTCISVVSLGNPCSAKYKFWNAFGPFLKNLDFGKVAFASQQDATKLFEMSPNLEHLKLASLVWSDTTTHPEPTRFVPPADIQLNLKSVSIGLQKRFPMSWMSFFSRFQNIQKFELTTTGWDLIEVDINTILDTFAKIRKSLGTDVLNLTHLSLCNKSSHHWRLDGRSARKLCRLQLPLLKLELAGLRVGKNVLARVIQSHQGTLQSLVIARTFGRFFYSFPYEVLPEKLKELCLSGRVFPTWKFLKYTPNLQKLVVNLKEEKYKGVYIRSCVEFRQGHIPVLPELTNLSYALHDDVVSVKTLTLLTKAMPNLIHLETSVDVQGYKEIRKGWMLGKSKIEYYAGKGNNIFAEYFSVMRAMFEPTTE